MPAITTAAVAPGREDDGEDLVRPADDDAADPLLAEPPAAVGFLPAGERAILPSAFFTDATLGNLGLGLGRGIKNNKISKIVYCTIMP